MAEDYKLIAGELYLLKRKRFDLYRPDSGEAVLFVVRAADEKTARAVVANECGVEGREPWLREDTCDCVRLYAGGPQSVLYRHLSP